MLLGQPWPAVRPPRAPKFNSEDEANAIMRDMMAVGRNAL